jgi:hypothetical protein
MSPTPTRNIYLFEDPILHTGCPKNGGLTTYYRIQDV